VQCLGRFIIVVFVLTACSSPAPLRPTAASVVDVTASIPASVNTPTNTSTPVIAESTTPDLPTPPAPAEVGASSPITRLAIIDQSSLIDTSRAGWWSIKTLGPVGQTFRPALAGLDAIEVWTEDQWTADCAGTGVTLQVNLRETAIEGSLIAASLPTVLPRCFEGIAHFDFSTLAALTPDKEYVVEVVVLSEDNWGVAWQQIPDSYPRGTSIVLGALSDADLWFQEGLRDLTPPIEAYCLNNLWQHVRRADGSVFKDEDDCIQYVTTR
jgi:hypothetical protein